MALPVPTLFVLQTLFAERSLPQNPKGKRNATESVQLNVPRLLYSVLLCVSVEASVTVNKVVIDINVIK